MLVMTVAIRDGASSCDREDGQRHSNEDGLRWTPLASHRHPDAFARLDLGGTVRRDPPTLWMARPGDRQRRPAIRLRRVQRGRRWAFPPQLRVSLAR